MTVHKGVKASLISLGFTTILVQLLIVREFLNVFQGNELIIGAIFCIWMVLTATGAAWGNYLFRKALHLELITRIILFESLLPALIIPLLYFLTNKLFPTGTTPPLHSVLLLCLGLLFPFCILNGILFVMLTALLSSVKNRISASYGWESAGGICAGIVYSTILSYRMSTFNVISLLLFINLTIFIYVHRNSLFSLKSSLIVTGTVVLIVLIVFNTPDFRIRQLQFSGQQLIHMQETPYGNITITRTSDQYNVYENGTLFFSTGNTQIYEEAVHFAMLQNTNAEDILIVSGGLTGMVHEALKYRNVKHIDYIELNPWLIDAERKFSDIPDKPFVHVLTGDIRSMMKDSSGRYDVIILAAPDPYNAQINRYFTLEFFRNIRKMLKGGGVFEISLSSTENYMNEEAKQLNGIVFETLKNVFKEVTLIPGGKNYFLASDHSLATNLGYLSNNAEINNDYVNAFYIDDELLQQRSRMIMFQITDKSYPVNSDLEPLAYYVQISHWIKKYEHVGLYVLLIVAVITFMIILLLFKGLNPVGWGVFIAGFAGSSAEFLMIIQFQSAFGYVYRMIGIIVACYMAGLTAGTLLRINYEKVKPGRFYFRLQWMLLILIMLIPVYAMFLLQNELISGKLAMLTLFVFTGIIAMVSGLIFNVATVLYAAGNTAGRLYGLDLTGSAAGVLVTSLYCLPLFGMVQTCLYIALLIVSGLVIYGVKKAV